MRPQPPSHAKQCDGVGWFWLKIDGPGVAGGLFIYQASASTQTSPKGRDLQFLLQLQMLNFGSPSKSITFIMAFARSIPKLGRNHRIVFASSPLGGLIIASSPHTLVDVGRGTKKQILAAKKGFLPQNHDKQTCKMFPNNNHSVVQ